MRDGDQESTLRSCLLEPVPECYLAADILSSAIDAHLASQSKKASSLIQAADLQKVRQFTETVWGAGAEKRHGFILVRDSPPYLSAKERPRPRMPNSQTRHAVLLRDGYHCRFCGLPVIPSSIRRLLCREYPDALGWDKTNISQHAAFQCLWLQFDHILPNSRGGTSELNNIVITCAPCNFGRMQTTLEEARLIDPLSRPTPKKWRGFDKWDGLERVVR
jgi:5-methylcytosine-specific restriction endonuclease McrA